MKRTVLSPEKRKTSTTEPSSDPSAAGVHQRSAVVASLAKDRSRPNQSFSCLTLSPKGRYALVAGKETIQLVSVGPDGLNRIRSTKIVHHFYKSSESASASASASSKPSQESQRQPYGDVRMIFHPDYHATAGAAMNLNPHMPPMNLNPHQQFGNVTVTKVAWSNNYAPAKKNHLSGLQFQYQQRSSIRALSQREISTTPAVDEIMGSPHASSMRNIEIGDRKHQQQERKHKRRPRRKGSSGGSHSERDYHEQDRSPTSDINHNSDEDEESMTEDESLVAVAGSNGVVAVWTAKRLLFSDFMNNSKEKSSKTPLGGFHIGGASKTLLAKSPSSATMLAKQQRTQQPEAILNQHTRAVNGMAWHPTRKGLLLTASQDGSAKLWERLLAESADDDKNNTKQQQQSQQQNPQSQNTKESGQQSSAASGSSSWFSMVGGVVSGGSKSKHGANRDSPGEEEDEDDKKYTWRCKATFSLGEQEAIRDIRWNSVLTDVFGVVTSNGNLVVYNMHVSVKALVKIAAHTGDAASLDWHPRWPYIVATGGSGDRFVKIWDLESKLDPIVGGDGNASNQKKQQQSSSGNPAKKSNSTRKEMYQQENANTHGSVKSSSSSNFSTSSGDTHHSSIGISSFSSYVSPRDTSVRSTTSTWAMGGSRHKSTLSGFSKYVLSISASVTQVRWRPPSNDFIPSSSSRDDPNNNNNNNNNKPENMVDRHDSMLAVVTARQTSAGGSGTLSLWSFHRPFMSLSVVEGHEESAIEDFVWIRTPQTVPQSSIGISKPEPQLLLASESNLTASQRFRNKSIDSSESNQHNHFDEDEPAGDFHSVSYIWQNVLSVGRDGQCIMQSFARGERRIRHVPSSCFAMANLSPFQQGYGSLQCFSVYQDVPNREEDDFELTGLRQDEHTARAPGVFYEEDLQKSLAASDANKHVSPGLVRRLPSSVPKLRFSVTDQGNLDSNGLPIVNDESALYIAPEVLHMSRFARLYKMYPDAQCPTRVELCLYNSRVAEQLKCGPLARMWKTVSSLLHASGLEEIPSHNASAPTNAFQFVIFPTVRSLLLERAEAGDVQTNVALCEVLQVIDPSGNQTRIPGLGIQLVREWYLSYIDLLHQMCLFSAAAFLIKHCRDPAIGALSQQSTTIHESCPRCGKPLEWSAEEVSSKATGSSGSGRQICKNCRRRVGICFICHEPVQGVYVWCPGCGHGGHLEHALQWFGGLDGRAVRTVCPTGCGHKCNLVQFASTFPRTMSMALSDSTSTEQHQNQQQHASLAIPGHQARCIPATASALYNLDKHL